MPIEKLSLSTPRYNPETRAFEAEACLFQAGEFHSYPVHVSATPQTDYQRVMKGLTARALARLKAGSRMVA